MSIEIPTLYKCQNDECGQEFNQGNMSLAVCLYGVIFLVRAGTQDQNGKGYVGFTCPKCLKTSLFEKTYQEVLEIKELLSEEFPILTSSIPTLHVPKSDNTAEMSVYKTALNFEPNFKYYSPFMLEDGILNKFDIKRYGLNPENNDDVFDKINNYVSEEIPDLEERFCSYLDDSNRPDEIYTIIYWYKGKDIQSLVQLEKEQNVRIFPRYHYYAELVGYIDSLLDAHYFQGKSFDQAKKDHQKETQATFEMLKAYAREKNLNFENLVDGIELNDPQVLQAHIEENQKQNDRDPKISGMFLDVLICKPSPLGGIIYQGYCDYLWAEVDPFKNKDIPKYFVDELEDEKLKNKIWEMREHHSKMVELIQENFTKPYVQEFLKSDLIPFLEDYEIIARSKGISYAEIWKLKESYLKKLNKATKIGLRTELPYAMYREGEGWKIVFDGQSFGGLSGKGFLWLYLTLLHQPSPVYYTSLHDTYGTKPEQGSGDQANYADNPDKDIESKWNKRGYRDFEQEAYEEKAMDYMEYSDQLRTTRSGVLTKQYYADTASLHKFQEELEEKELALEHARLHGNIEVLEEKMDDLTEFMELLEKQYGIRKVKTKPGEGNYKLISKRIKDDRYPKINGKIKKNYRDALKILERIKEAKDLHNHLSNCFRSEGGAFIYEPPEGIKWHLD